MNGETQQLTQPQRKALADMLKEWGDVWNRAKTNYEETRTSRKEAQTWSEDVFTEEPEPTVSFQ